MVDVEKKYNGVYQELMKLVGEENTKLIYDYYRGQQLTFPMRLYSQQYAEQYLIENYETKSLGEIARHLKYSERWIKQMVGTLRADGKMPPLVSKEKKKKG